MNNHASRVPRGPGGGPAENGAAVDGRSRDGGRAVAAERYIDAIVPRGGKGLIEAVSRDARVPVIKHLDGVCHVFIDDTANVAKAIAIADNAKTQRYGTCNTMETLLVAQAIAPRVLPEIGRIYAQKKVEMRCDTESREILKKAGVKGAKAATEQDFYSEYLAPIVSIRVVPDLDEAIAHIAKYGSQHTDAIVAGDRARAERFLREVDSASVMWNASTRFADGYEYGLGAGSHLHQQASRAVRWARRPYCRSGSCSATGTSAPVAASAFRRHLRPGPFRHRACTGRRRHSTLEGDLHSRGLPSPRTRRMRPRAAPHDVGRHAAQRRGRSRDQGSGNTYSRHANRNPPRTRPKRRRFLAGTDASGNRYLAPLDRVFDLAHFAVAVRADDAQWFKRGPHFPRKPGRASRSIRASLPPHRPARS